MTLLITWAGIKYGVGFQYMALITNTWVHIFMYYYFYQTSQGVKNIWWKPYLTIMQMIQFGINGAGIWLWFYWHSIYGCCGDNTTVYLVLFANVSFLVLFANNFVHNYMPHVLPSFMQDKKAERHSASAPANKGGRPASTPEKKKKQN